MSTLLSLSETPRSRAVALGRIINRLRQCANLSQDELSKRSGLKQASISYIEKGRKSPSLDKLFCIAEALGLPSSELLRLVEQARTKSIDNVIGERAHATLSKTEGWMSLEEAEKRLNGESKGGDQSTQG